MELFSKPVRLTPQMARGDFGNATCLISANADLASVMRLL